MEKFQIITDKEIAEKVKAIILSDFTVFDSTETLARKVGCTKKRLKDAFISIYKIRVHEFSRAERMKAAKKLLQETNLTLQVIAEMSGYTEGNNFQQSFKRIFGMTPGTWRQKNTLL